MNQRSFIFLIVVAAVAGLLWLVSSLFQSSTPEPGNAGTLSLSDVLTSAEEEGFARVSASREFSFPADHGPHADFKSEWWYFTGNLESAPGKGFGFQFTLFRSALSRHKAVRASQWAAHQAYMGHFAITDVEAGKFYAFERFSRDGMGLAGAEAAPLSLWIDDWGVTGKENGSDEAMPELHLSASEQGIGLELALKSLKPIVLQGENGRSVKGDDSDNASYYYSVTRLDAQGTITLPGRSFEVNGLAWMDREWSSHALGKNTIGWDWFALQLDNGCDLMLYQLRRADGSISPHSHGCWVLRDGQARNVAHNEFSVEVSSQWNNGSGSNYPSQWSLSLPDLDLILELKPQVPDQELKFGFRYWEGAVFVNGKVGDEAVNGRGYVELTGYAGDPIR
ncbi:MAG: lipocalin-like domain-containing protein [Planctomycetota bacterium]